MRRLSGQGAVAAAVLVAACASPAQAATSTFEGSCGSEELSRNPIAPYTDAPGRGGPRPIATFDPPLRFLPRPTRYRFEATSARCSGTLDGLAVRDVPAHFGFDGIADLSCDQFKSGVGRGALRFTRGTATRIDDAVIDVSPDFRAFGNPYVIGLTGRSGGSAHGRLELVVADDAGAQCDPAQERPGVRESEFTFSFTTASPLVDRLRTAVPLTLALRARARQPVADARRRGLHLRLRSNAPVTAAIVVFSGGRRAGARTATIDRAQGDRIEVVVPLRRWARRGRARSFHVRVRAEHRSGAVAQAVARVRVVPGLRATGVRGTRPERDHRTVLASRLDLVGDAADGLSEALPPALSRDGRYVVFASRATNFPGAASALAVAAAPRIYRKDTLTGALELVSRADGPQSPAVDGDFAVGASSDTRHVCWAGRPPGAEVPYAGPDEGALMVRDVDARRTWTVPGTAMAAADADRSVYGCDVSDDGRRVVYVTRDAHDPADTDRQKDLYLYDLTTGRWRLLTPKPAVAGSYNYYGRPEITPDGRHLAYEGVEGDPEGGLAPDTGFANDVHVLDLVRGHDEVVSAPTGCDVPKERRRSRTTYDEGSRWASISDDGRYVAFESDQPLDPEAPTEFAVNGSFPVQIYLRDRRTCETHLVSRRSGAAGAPADQLSRIPRVSADGRLVAFTSWADNLDPEVPEEGNRTDVYVRDWKAGRTSLISRASGIFGVAANSNSQLAAISGDGRRVAFVSTADNLVDVPTKLTQIYVRDVLDAKGVLPADLAGDPVIERLLYRRGRSAGGGPGIIELLLSEPAVMRLRIARLGRRSAVERRAVGLEGANRVEAAALGPGRYRVTVTATDFAHRRTSRGITVRIPGGR